MNSDNEIVWKESDKAEDSLEEPADKAVATAKRYTTFSKKESTRTKESQGIENRVHPQAQNLRQLKGKE